jgi:hypothetical protein
MFFLRVAPAFAALATLASRGGAPIGTFFLRVALASAALATLASRGGAPIGTHFFRVALAFAALATFATFANWLGCAESSLEGAVPSPVVGHYDGGTSGTAFSHAAHSGAGDAPTGMWCFHSSRRSVLHPSRPSRIGSAFPGLPSRGFPSSLRVPPSRASPDTKLGELPPCMLPTAAQPTHSPGCGLHPSRRSVLQRSRPSRIGSAFPSLPSRGFSLLQLSRARSSGMIAGQQLEKFPPHTFFFFLFGVHCPPLLFRYESRPRVF